MIFTDRKITIRNGKSSINEPVILYRGDFEVSIRFTIMESKFRFKSGVNLVDSEKASFGQLAILAPYGGNVFSDEVKCEDGTVTFTLTKEMIDQLEEVGLYSFQIRLFDYYRESRVSIPPVEFGIEVREPIASEDHDNEVNNAIVGYSIAKVVDGLKEDIGDTFDDNGNYNKTDWKTGDRISEGKLNKIEDAIDKINKNNSSIDKKVSSNFNVLQTEIDNLILESGESNLEVVQARAGEATLDRRLDKIEDSIDMLVLESGESNPEVVQARGGEETLNDRLDKIEDDAVILNTREQQERYYDLYATEFATHKLAWPTHSKLGKYEAWPYGNVFYDAANDRVCLIYNSKSTHTSTDGKVYFRFKNDHGMMSEPVLVASAAIDGDTTSTGRRCHGAGIDKNGHYIALVLHHGHISGATGDGILWVYKSVDKGETWFKTKAIVDGGDLLTGEAGSCYQLKSGRLLSFARLSPSPSMGAKIIYSDDGDTWTGYKLNTSDAKEPLEGMFVQISDSSIYCIVRGTLYTGRFDKLENTYITESHDDGVTWTALRKLDNIDMTLNNGCLIYHDDIKSIEMIYGSRLKQSDGKGSLYQRIFTEQQLKDYDLGTEHRIASGAAGSDFGYVGGCKSKNNVVNIFYYNGTASDTSIYNMEGVRRSWVPSEGVSGSNICTLKYNVLDGSEAPSYFNKFVGENYKYDESRLIVQRIAQTEANKTNNIPVKKAGILETLKVSSFNGYTRQFYTTIQGELYMRVNNNTAEDVWSDWALIPTTRNLSTGTSVIMSPFSEIAYLKSVVLIPADTTKDKQILDLKTHMNSEFFDQYPDGVRLEVIYKGTGADNAQVISFDSAGYKTGQCPTRIVTSSPYEQNYFIDTYFNTTDGTLYMYVKYPLQTQTLIVRVVGLLFKRPIY